MHEVLRHFQQVMVATVQTTMMGADTPWRGQRPKARVDRILAAEPPGAGKEANWLPAPKGDFLLTMRMYWPKETPPSILPPGKGTWEPPPVRRVS